MTIGIWRALAVTLLSGIAAAQQIEVRVNQRLSSESTSTGSRFEATSVRPVTLFGRTCAKGSLVSGVVTEAKPSGRLKAPGILEVEPASIRCGARTFSISAEAVRLEGRSHTKRNAVLIGGGAAAGGLLGGIFGGGKGALIGAAIGAGTGTAGAAAGGRHEAVIESEAVIAWNVNASQGSARIRDRAEDRPAYVQRRSDDGGDHDYEDNRTRDHARYVFTDNDQTYLRSCLASNYRLPPGLAKKGKIPPGHARKMQQAQYGDPLPGACVQRLSPIPVGWSRVVVDDRVLLLNAARDVIDYFIWRQ